MPGTIHCKRPLCNRVFRNQAKFASHMWEHRREDKAANAKPTTAATKRPYVRKVAPVTPSLSSDPSVLAAALMGYEQQLGVVNGKIAEVQAALGGGHRKAVAPASSTGPAAPSNHRISAEGRARIAAAQRRRWAARGKAGAATPSPATPVES